MSEIPDFRKPVWLVMGMHTSGNLVIHGICTEQPIANKMRKIIQDEIDAEFGSVIRVWVEASEMNHMFVWELRY